MFLPRCGWRQGCMGGAMVLALALAGCGTEARKAASVYQNEHFKPDETFSRLFDANAAATCEAARLALLSQGYVINTANKDVVTGNKRFQPDGDMHIEINFTVTCAPDARETKLSTVFVNAVQERYALKKASTSASVGLPVGSLSIPLSSSDDSLVRVGSETIPAGNFYDRFFALVQRYVREQACGEDDHCQVAAPRAASAGTP